MTKDSSKGGARRQADQAREQAYEGEWIVDGQRADNLGHQAMQLVADETGLTVTVAGVSDYHEGKTFTPAIATEAGTATTVQQGVVHEGAGPQDIAQ
jgi:hypothetical protein